MSQPDLSRAHWHKSSHSDSAGGSCVEVAPVVFWRKSSHSDSQGGTCVEVARLERVVAVRDSKNPDGPALTFAPAAWRGFVAGLQASH